MNRISVDTNKEDRLIWIDGFEEEEKGLFAVWLPYHLPTADCINWSRHSFLLGVDTVWQDCNEIIKKEMETLKGGCFERGISETSWKCLTLEVKMQGSCRAQQGSPGSGGSVQGSRCTCAPHAGVTGVWRASQPDSEKQCQGKRVQGALPEGTTQAIFRQRGILELKQLQSWATANGKETLAWRSRKPEDHLPRSHLSCRHRVPFPSYMQVHLR